MGFCRFGENIRGGVFIRAQRSADGRRTDVEHAAVVEQVPGNIWSVEFLQQAAVNPAADGGEETH